MADNSSEASPPLTPEQETLLKKLYFEDKCYFGRDKLWGLARSIAGDRGPSRRQIMDWLKKQEVHQLYNPTRATTNVRRTLTKAPMKVVEMDLVDMQTQAYDGYQYIFTAVDTFSKYFWAVALKNKEARSVVEGLADLLEQMKAASGKLPSVLRSDNGSEFIDGRVKAFLAAKEVKQVFSSPAKPQSNGQIERMNGVIKRQLSMYRTQEGTKDWVSYLPIAVRNYNNLWQRVIKKRPIDALKEDEQAQEVTRENIIKEIKPRNDSLDGPQFEVGDKVRIKLINIGHSKGVVQGGTNWSREIYTVRSKSRPNVTSLVSYRLTNEQGQAISDVFYGNDLLLVPALENPVKAEVTFIIQRLIRPTTRAGKAGYIVRWKGYLASDDTFEPREQLLEDVPRLVKQFDEEHTVVWKQTSNKWSYTWVEK